MTRLENLLLNKKVSFINSASEEPPSNSTEQLQSKQKKVVRIQ
jgi:hypothetical protein